MSWMLRLQPLLVLGFILPLGLMTVSDAEAQGFGSREAREAYREYLEDLRDADDFEDLREAREEYFEELREAREEFFEDARRFRRRRGFVPAPAPYLDPFVDPRFAPIPRRFRGGYVVPPRVIIPRRYGHYVYPRVYRRPGFSFRVPGFGLWIGP